MKRAIGAAIRVRQLHAYVSLLAARYGAHVSHSPLKNFTLWRYNLHEMIQL